MTFELVDEFLLQLAGWVGFCVGPQLLKGCDLHSSLLEKCNAVLRLPFKCSVLYRSCGGDGFNVWNSLHERCQVCGWSDKSHTTKTQATSTNGKASLLERQRTKLRFS